MCHDRAPVSTNRKRQRWKQRWATPWSCPHSNCQNSTPPGVNNLSYEYDAPLGRSFEVVWKKSVIYMGWFLRPWYWAYVPHIFTCVYIHVYIYWKFWYISKQYDIWVRLKLGSEIDESRGRLTPAMVQLEPAPSTITDSAWWFHPLWKVWKSIGMIPFPIYIYILCVYI